MASTAKYDSNKMTNVYYKIIMRLHMMQSQPKYIGAKYIRSRSWDTYLVSGWLIWLIGYVASLISPMIFGVDRTCSPEHWKSIRLREIVIGTVSLANCLNKAQDYILLCVFPLVYTSHVICLLHFKLTVILLLKFFCYL